jgi:hypothetical protein
MGQGVHMTAGISGKTAVLDCTFPSDNDWGVPTLDVERQATALPAPFVAWGSIARPTRMPGCYHFYVDDAKFAALWKDPTPIVNSRCIAAVEPNFSTIDQMPLAKVVWDVYRKRWLARFWQMHGVAILVDLNVADRCQPVNLLGVPRGWTAFCTRYTSEGIEAVQAQADAAERHTGTKPSLVVYSGGEGVGTECRRRGWQWFPNQVTAKAAEAKQAARAQQLLRVMGCGFESPKRRG